MKETCSKKRNRIVEQLSTHDQLLTPIVKPLLRGWFHAAAALAALLTTIALCWLSRADSVKCFCVLIFGLTMIELYTTSALYHIGHWQPARKSFLRNLDHANIFVFIAGTYTPLCSSVLAGPLRVTFLVAIWLLALLGVAFTLFSATLRLPRWIGTLLYVVMGWIALLAIPAFLAVLPWTFVWILISGGLFYTLGALIYALRWPDPLPRFFGYHEIFHLFVIAGSVAFAASIWIWILPFPHRPL